jgi:hypothetical protein
VVAGQFRERLAVLDGDAGLKRLAGEDRVQLRPGDAVHGRQAGPRDPGPGHLTDHAAVHVKQLAPGGGRVPGRQARLGTADRRQCPQRVDQLDDPNAVDGRVQACPDLNDVDLIVRVTQCDGGGKPADSAAHDKDAASVHFNHL